MVPDCPMACVHFLQSPPLPGIEGASSQQGDLTKVGSANAV